MGFNHSDEEPIHVVGIGWGEWIMFLGVTPCSCLFGVAWLKRTLEIRLGPISIGVGKWG